MNGRLRTLISSCKARLGSLKLRLALASVTVIGLCVGATALLVVRDIGMRAERSILDSTLDVDTVSKTIDSRLHNRELALSRAAAQWPVAEALREDDAAAFLRNQAALGALFSRVMVIDANGKVVAQAGVQAEPRDVGARLFFLRAMAGQGRAITAEFGTGENSRPEIVVAVPLDSGKGTDAPVRALLCGVLRPEDNLLTDSTGRHAGTDDPIDTVITDAAGRILSHPDARWLQHDVAEEPRLRDAAARWRHEGAPLQPNAWTWRLGSQFVAMSAVPEAGWMAFRTASADLLLGGPAAARTETLWFGALVALVGAGLITAWSHWLLKPMGALERRALRLLDDQLPAESQWPEAAGEIGHLSQVFQHVLALRAASQQRSEELLELMRVVMRHAPVGICVVRDGRLELASQRLLDTLGYHEAELVGQPFQVLLPGDAPHQALRSAALAAFRQGGSYLAEHELRHRDGRRIWAYLQGAALTPSDPAGGTVWILSDISELRAQREQLSWTASHDALTRLVNRGEFERRLDVVCSSRRRGESSCLLMIDLDGFKAVNDSAGHAAGDAMLQDVAALLSQQVRDSDTVARLGGDEFAVILRGCELPKALVIAEQMRSRLEAHRRDWLGLTLRVGSSIGVVHLNRQYPDAATAMAVADAACYTAKRMGKNRVSVGVAGVTEPMPL